MNETELLGKYKLVLGLEIHMHTNTKTGMFCGCSADIWGAEPNTHVCPVCLGLPGALPVPNMDAIRNTQMLGLATNCVINKETKFDRKHYFYPDLPKGYQISQYKQPLCGEGYVILDSGKKIEIERIHQEEDVAKSTHVKGKTLIDFNKSGTPLTELVTKPVFTNTEDAVEFCKKIQQIVRTLGIGDADMEKGQMRLEANISIRTEDMENRGELPKYKVEVKNINSFKFMEKAVRAEITRQRELLESGVTPIQENRGYDENTNKTVSQRSKEEAHDYRYFPEPDIPPMVFDDDYINNLRSTLPELPDDTKKRLVSSFGINEKSAKHIVDVLGIKDIKRFEELSESGVDNQKIANFLINKKEAHEMSNEAIIEELKKEDEPKIGSDELRPIVENIVSANPNAVTDYKNGKENSIQFLLGLSMRETKGKAKPQEILDIIKEILNR